MWCLDGVPLSPERGAEVDEMVRKQFMEWALDGDTYALGVLNEDDRRTIMERQRQEQS